MPEIFPIEVTRADGAHLGGVYQEDNAFQAYRTRITYARGPEGLKTTCDSLDAAVAWIAGNPYLPDAGTCPHTHGVYGPILAQWGDLRVIGVTHVQEAIVSKELGTWKELRQCALLVLNADGQVKATFRHTDTGWHLAIQAQARLIRRRRVQWAPALQMFGTEVIEHLYTGSQHQRLMVRADRTPFEDRVTRFLAGQPARLAMDTSAPPAITPVCATVDPTAVYRNQDTFFLGTFSQESGQVTAERHDHAQIRETMTHASLDAAVAWLDESPYAPDLDRFPLHGKVYAQTLWQTSEHTVLGVLGHVRGYTPTPPLVSVLNARGKVIASITLTSDDPSAHQVILSVHGVRTMSVHATQDAALARIDQDLFGKILPPCVQGGSDLYDVLARTQAFLHARPHMIQDMQAGRGAAR